MTTTATLPALPTSLFTINYAAHEDCRECERLAVSAKAYARATGSVGSNMTDGPHLVMVSRTPAVRVEICRCDDGMHARGIDICLFDADGTPRPIVPDYDETPETCLGPWARGYTLD